MYVTEGELAEKYSFAAKVSKDF